MTAAKKARSPRAHAPPPGNGKARELGGGAGLGGTAAVQNGQRDCGEALAAPTRLRDRVPAIAKALAARGFALRLTRVGNFIVPSGGSTAAGSRIGGAA